LGVPKKQEVKSVVRATQIIECLNDGTSEKSLVQISREVGLHVATARRLLMTLVGTQFVRQNAENKKYSLGLKSLLTSKNAGFALDLRQVSIPYLSELMRKSGETANLVTEDKGEAVYIEQVECKNYLRTANKMGSRAPLYCTAVGKIFLSWRSPEERRRFLQSISLIPQTSKTITDIDKLLVELEKISKTNIAIDNEEQMNGERCLATGIFNQNGDCIAAISISGPVFRLTPSRIRELKSIVLEIGLKISEQLGFEERSYKKADGRKLKIS